MAKEKGYYHDAGLEVDIVEASPEIDSISEVLEKRAMFGVASSELALARANGKPVVVLGVIFQHSPLALFARRTSEITSVHDLLDRKVVLSLQESEILAYFQREHLPVDRLKLLPHQFSVEDLLKGRTDAIAGYTTDEPFYLQTSSQEFMTFLPRTSGIDFYGDTFFTTEDFIKTNPELVIAFRNATLLGWKYALTHKEETAVLIREKYAPDLSMDKLIFEANEMKKLILPDLIELGYSHQGRWQHILNVYKELNMLPPNAKIEGILYLPETNSVPAWIILVIISSIILVTVISLVARNYYSVASELKQRILEIEKLHKQLKGQAVQDSLTALFNRRYLDEILPIEFKKALLGDYPLTIAMIDVDHFKILNDEFGHAVGDKVLALLGSILNNNIGPEDYACRYGGEEFIVIFPHINQVQATNCIELWCQRFIEEVQLINPSIHSSLSIGVADFPTYNDLVNLLSAADQALYSAKREGRNRIVFSKG